MKNFLKNNKFIKKYFDDDVDILMKMTRMVFVMIFVTLFSAIIIAFFSDRGDKLFPYLLSVIIGMGSVALAFFLSTKVKNIEFVDFFILIPVNTILLPSGFLSGGGMINGLMMGFILVFIFFRGWRFFLMLIFTMAADLTVAWIFYTHPETYVSIKDVPFVTQMTSVIGVFLVGSMIGILFKYQNSIYNKQKDLTEQRSQEVKELSDSKSLFFANMSHEIRTPINTIIGLNEMILREDVSDEVAENAINIQNASKILLALINDILDLSKMESGKMEIVPAQYETGAMFSDLVNIIWVRANQKGLDFKIDVAEDIPSMLYGDEVRIKQVLTNILTNAVKYTEKGSVTLTVTGEKTGENTIRLKIAVDDTGIGIRKENLDDLFTVFKRVDQQKTKKIEGTGLGLAISKQLVEMMGGTIKVDSIYQKGSCFTVTLDQQIIDSRPLGSMQYAVKRGIANREKYDRSFEAPDARVLVVDDNEMNLMVAKKLLRDTKVQVELAASGRECLEKTKESSYHVILMDHMMPEMDGEETLRILRNRQDGFCQKTPVIALTANVMTNAGQWYQERGFDGYLAKPISGSLLEAVLLKFLPEELIEYSGRTSGETETPEMSAMLFHRKKKKIAVCAECVCDLPQEWVEKFDIRLMYYYVTTEEGRFIDTREIGSSELMEYMAQGKSAKSSAAPLEEYEAFLSDQLVEAEQVIFITIASGLNNHGYETATQAAKNFDNVTVFHSGHLSSGMGIIVLKAAQMAEEGASLDEILEELTRWREKVSTSFILQTVDSMYQNQRVSRKVWNLSKMVQLRPVLRISQGRFAFDGFRLGNMDQAARRYIRQQLRHRRKIDNQLLFVTYVGLNTKQLDEIRKEIEKHMKFEVVRFQKASATISSNCEVGIFGLLYVRKK